MAHRDLYIVELAQTVAQMFEAGNVDPSAEEIAETHFGRTVLGGEITEGVRKRLKKIRDLLEEDFGLLVCLLRRNYYTQQRRDNPPQTEAEARACIAAGGFRIPAHGIRLQTGDSDLIWQAIMQRNLTSGAGKVKKSVDRTLDAVGQNQLSRPRAARLLDDAQQRMAPKDPTLAKRVMKELPRKARP